MCSLRAEGAWCGEMPAAPGPGLALLSCEGRWGSLREWALGTEGLPAKLGSSAVGSRSDFALASWLAPPSSAEWRGLVTSLATGLAG